jgi:hypothetical protein
MRPFYCNRIRGNNSLAAQITDNPDYWQALTNSLAAQITDKYSQMVMAITFNTVFSG